MGAIGLNPIRLDRIGLDPIRINAIKLGVPGASGSDRPYIDPEVLASLKAVCICYGKSNDDPDRAVVNNLVDPDNPFVISNAAFKLNSGFGKYGMDFLEWKANSGMNFTSTKLTSTKPNLPGGWLTFRNVSGLISETKVKVSGAPKEFVFIGNNNGADDKFSVTINNGVYTIPEFTLSSASGFYINNNSGDWSNLVIEQIPSFEGAFVTDGIDDLIKSTKSATEMLDGSNEVTVVSMIHQIKTNDDTTRNNWFFTPVSYLENRVVKDKIGKTGIYGYTSTNVTNAQISDITPILGDKNDYTLYSKIEDGDRDYFTVEGFQNQGIWYVSSIAWYWTIIANKVLTTDQINQVIAYFNLDRTLKPDILCNTIKQGITNENHAEFGDRLIDFSGNGRDIQLNNIAWKGDSGIGKYEVDFLDSSIWTSSNSTITSSKIDCKNAISHIMLLYYNVGDKEYPDIPSFKIIKTGADIDYSYIDETGSPKSVKIVDGVNVLPASHNTLYSGSGRFCGFGNPGIGNSVIITQIPSHAGALWLDGVNDFGKVTGMPIYKDYTVVADYERFYLEPITGGRASILSKSSKVGDGSFIFNLENQDGDKACYTFGEANGNISDDITRIIRYQSKYYNTKTLSIGTAEDNDFMVLGKVREVDSRCFCGAIYSLMSFPYSMSEFLIERQLKKHKLGTLYPDMVEFRPIVKSNLPYSSITYSVNPGEYISVDSMVTITVTLPNTSDKLMEVSCNAISDISISGDNGVYEITGKIVKSPQKINLVISSYLTMLSNSTLISNETLIKNE